tara:strand:+ start:1077 stop:1214 length:138 start_codon:yes stop_codon:yes gene_type:complete
MENMSEAFTPAPPESGENLPFKWCATTVPSLMRQLAQGISLTNFK